MSLPGASELRQAVAAHLRADPANSIGCQGVFCRIMSQLLVKLLKKALCQDVLRQSLP